jgi:hypothetical protein
VAPVAERGFFGVFAPAQVDRLLFGDRELERREGGGSMRAVAERLLGGAAAAAPPVRSRFELEGGGAGGGNDDVGHGMCTSRRRNGDGVGTS